ncbi:MULTISPECIES: acyl-CoA dehydrogenase [unclassified Sphingobium]|uniref:acyl-CoA dehydrogenase n=1 Tax=unclassified Sphingobium TaxID=2611147 RepID=UPI0035A6E383
MNLDLSEENNLLVAMVDKLLVGAGGVDRLRKLQPGVMDRDLHREFAGMGLLTMRALSPEQGGLPLFDAMLAMEQAGRHLPRVPLAETLVAGGVLGRSTAADAESWLARIGTGEAVVTLALHDVAERPAQLVPFGAACDAVVFRKAAGIYLQPGPLDPLSGDHADQCLARFAETGAAVIELGQGEAAVGSFLAAVEEWKLLISAELWGLSSAMLEMASRHANERHQFDRPIGSFQAISHPLADRAVDNEAARLLGWWTAWLLAEGSAEAAAAISMTFAWSTKTADATARRALHTFGGYGLSLEHNAQVYFRHAKALPLLLGDPGEELARVADRMWRGETAALPDGGPCPLDFGIDEETAAVMADTRAILEPLMTPELHATLPDSYDGHVPEIAQALGKAGLLFSDWPKEWGGRGSSATAMLSALRVWDELGYPGHAQSVTNMVGHIVREFASDEIRQLVVPRFAAGEALGAMGYSEPGSGSDIFGCQTKSRWDEKTRTWTINGQKMWTTGANLADYVLLLTRSEPGSTKHRGLTLFLVPTDTPGFEVHPIHTVMGERTNATFYTDIVLDDRWRVGPAHNGIKVMTWALTLEQLGAFGAGDRRALPALLDWAAQPDESGNPRMESKDVRRRLGLFELQARAGTLLADRATWHALSHPEAGRTGYGPMSKLFYSEMVQQVLADLMDMTAPDCLINGSGPLAVLERLYRQSQVATVYAGSSEIQRSQIAEVFLGLPRSR